MILGLFYLTKIGCFLPAYFGCFCLSQNGYFLPTLTQYQHKLFVNCLNDNGIIQSMPRKGNCLDNSKMETFFGTMKREMYYGYEKEFKTREQLSMPLTSTSSTTTAEEYR